MTKEVSLMIIAMTIAMIVMLIFSKSISEYMEKRPTLQILALSFLILIGFMLTLEAAEIHVPKGYIYFVDTELNGIYRFNTLTDEFEAEQLIDCSAYDIPYSITIVNDFIYVTDAHGYVNSSTVHCYNISGVKQYSFTAGLNANEIIVNE